MEYNETIQKTLSNIGIAALNAMQEAAFESIRDKTNTTLLSPTGSGKTLAFLLPVQQLLDAEQPGVQCLVISPTRELAIQIERVWQKMATGFKVSTCYGGHSMQIETQNLIQPPALLIGTPGRILEHIARRTFDPGSVRILVLDEFDKSLSLGFQEHMTEIIKALKGLKKRVLASATDKLSIPAFTGIVQPNTLNFSKKDTEFNKGLVLRSVDSPTADKSETLFGLLCHLGSEPALIFCNLRESTEKVNAFLRGRGIDSAAYHGGMEQLDREKALIRFRNGSTVFLVTSDLAARGLDIPEVKNVIHFEIPPKDTDFLHRNGRTARMHAEGAAFLIASKEEPLPVYLKTQPETLELPEHGVLPPESPWTTLYISGGKKDKLGKGDIVGFLTQKGGLQKDELGKIELLDFMSFAAVKKTVVANALKQIGQEKMKGKKYKIGLDR
jgi:superfamily II DNA/RNA helicase